MFLCFSEAKLTKNKTYYQNGTDLINSATKQAIFSV